ncbi:MAG: hypothetical protein ACT4O6_11275 [Reyranella sp.]
MLDLLSKDGGQKQVYNGKSLVERLTGRFYTPDILAVDLASQVVRSFSIHVPRGAVINATDPFCGDGRLIVALLQVASRDIALAKARWVVELRDTDAEAIRQAKAQVASCALRLGMSVTVVARIGDSFAAEGRARFDFVVTNPPWELLKPDSREIAHMSSSAATKYRASLRAASRVLDDRFPDAKGTRAWGGWGTNLARCGWSLALSLCRPGGVVGIVLPSTLLGDQSSANSRRAAFYKNAVTDIVAYPPEARLFEKVDQPVVAITMIAGQSSSGQAQLRLFGADRKLLKAELIDVSEGEMQTRDWSIPVGFGVGSGKLLQSLNGLKVLRDLEGDCGDALWLGRELDETRIHEKTTSSRAYPFVKGRMIIRHSIVERPSLSVRAKLCSSLHSVGFTRAVWRDVSRASQRRRMIGTVIPAGWVAGNSLHVAYFRDGNVDRTLALHAILSSFVLELQVRTRLTTGHMSLGVVRQSRIPGLSTKVIATLSKAAKLASIAGDNSAASDALEIAVARAYDLDRNSMISILEHFSKITTQECDRLTCLKTWSV